MNPFEFWLTIIGPALMFAAAGLGWWLVARAVDALTHWWYRRTQRTEQAENQPVGARVGNRTPDPHDGAGKAA